MGKFRRLPGRPVRVTRTDCERVTRIADRLGLQMGDQTTRTAATVEAGMRDLQVDFGPGYFPFDFMANFAPEAYARNWAKTRFGLVERR